MRTFLRWMQTFRADEWGVHVVLVWVAAAVYYGAVAVDGRAYFTYVSFVCLWSAFLYAGAYVFNDYCDRHDDLRKPSLRRRSALHPRRTLFTSIAFILIGIVLAGAFEANRWTMVLVFACVLALVAYSLPPMRLKERGGLGVWTAALFQRIPVFWMVALAFPLSVACAAAITVWLAGIGVLFILEHQIEDLDVDHAAGVCTLATTAGVTRVRRLAARAYRIFGCVSVIAVLTILLAGTDDGRSLASGLTLGACSGVFVLLLRTRYAPNRAAPSFIGGALHASEDGPLRDGRA